MHKSLEKDYLRAFGADRIGEKNIRASIESYDKNTGRQIKRIISRTFEREYWIGTHGTYSTNLTFGLGLLLPMSDDLPALSFFALG